MMASYVAIRFKRRRGGVDYLSDDDGGAFVRHAAHRETATTRMS
jgi:hypothetical protein